MFSLMVADHVRIDSERVDENYTVHARAAERLVRSAFAGRILMTTLLAMATGAAVADLVAPTRIAQIMSVGATVLALLGFALNSVFGLEARVSAHRVFAHRLWLVSERYRSLLSEINEGFLDPETLIRRRDGLIEELHAIYSQGFGVDQPGFETRRLPPIALEPPADMPHPSTA